MKRRAELSMQSRRGVQWHKLWQTPERAAYLMMSSLALVILCREVITTGEWFPELGLVFFAGQVAFFLVMLFVREKGEEATR